MSMMQFRFEDENEKTREDQKRREREKQQELEKRRWEVQECERIRAENEEKEKQKKLENVTRFKSASEEISKVMNKVDELLIEVDLKSAPADKMCACKDALIHSKILFSKIQIEDLLREYGKVLKIADDEANKNSQISHGAVELISNDLSNFKTFLKVEAELLLKSGLKSETVDFLVNQIEEKIDQFIKNPITVDELLESIKSFQSFLDYQIEQILKDISSDNLRINLICGLGGLAIIAVNISAPDILTPVGAGASAGLGAKLVTDAVKKLVKKIT